MKQYLTFGLKIAKNFTPYLITIRLGRLSDVTSVLSPLIAAVP